MVPVADTILGGRVQFDHIAQQVPHIAEAVRWQCDLVAGTRVLYQDATWALLDSGGARIAFVLPEQHPDHVAYRVDNARLDEMAAQHGVDIAVHRDASRSIYLEGPGALCAEIVAYPEDLR